MADNQTDKGTLPFHSFKVHGQKLKNKGTLLSWNLQVWEGKVALSFFYFRSFGCDMAIFSCLTLKVENVYFWSKMGHFLPKN